MTDDLNPPTPPADPKPPKPPKAENPLDAVELTKTEKRQAEADDIPLADALVEKKNGYRRLGITTVEAIAAKQDRERYLEGLGGVRNITDWNALQATEAKKAKA